MDTLLDELSRSLLSLEKKHRDMLEWFFDHNDQTVPWADLSDPKFRLSLSPKGIYKPKGLDYALSVKQTLNSPYRDIHPLPNESGGWTYLYNQEEQNRADATDLFANRGLERCLHDGVPVGVLIQTTAKPNVTYKVWGLAMVRSWRDGVFTLEGLYAAQPNIVALAGYSERRARKVAEDHDSSW